ncbi:MAG: glycoside hydrolase family 3 C-terminal domain-containing protein [Clostridia bacterium]|nr:glycoside hydrolase family 3 C-terminal domain-containing protein [Clostridia bacterium]
MDKNALINSMTLEEKMLFLTQGEKTSGYERTFAIPRLGIGAKYLADGPHGVRAEGQNCTSFPNLCCMASSWDRDMLYKMGVSLADDCIHHNIDMLLGPGANIKRHILCGRNFEYFSEDPVLSGELAAGYINGLQSRGVAACLKHYALNNQEKDREYTSVEVDERVMREIYLKSFEIAIKKSAPVAVMCSYNKVDSVWCSENPFLLREILKNEWGYRGILMSDWGAVHDITKALPAGLDMQMPRNRNIVAQLTEGLKNGSVTEEQINDAVCRILDFACSPDTAENCYDRQKQHEVARIAARSGIVLLKNEREALPLTPKKYSKITIVGEYAKTPLICGQGSAEVYPDSEYVDSPYAEIEKMLGDVVTLDYYEGYKKREFSDKMLWPTVKSFASHIEKSDAVVFFVGSMESEDTEKYDRRTAELNPNFELFIKKAYDMGKKVIAVIQSGGAVIIEDWKNKTHAILQTWLGGEGAGNAIASVLTGDFNPCGKLSETFPTKMRTDLEYPGDGLKVTYKEGFDVGYRYYDKHPEEIAFPFGHGLSYTHFDYSDLQINTNESTLNVNFKLRNSGECDGHEVVQLYIGKDVSCVTRSSKELRAFEKVFLKANEEKEVSLKVDLCDLAYYNRSLHGWITEPGIYQIYVGSSSRDIRLIGEAEIKTKPPYSVQKLGESTMA